MTDICWTAFGKRFVFAWKSSDKPDWRRNAVPSTVVAYEAWDRRMKRKFGILQTLKWFHRVQPGGRLVVVSLHWRHRLCWSWFVEWSKVHHECRGFKITCAYSQFALVLWSRQIGVHWQNDDWIPALGPNGEGAPEVIWKHDIERAMYLERRRAETDA